MGKNLTVPQDKSGSVKGTPLCNNSSHHQTRCTYNAHNATLCIQGLHDGLMLALIATNHNPGASHFLTVIELRNIEQNEIREYSLLELGSGVALEAEALCLNLTANQIQDFRCKIVIKIDRKLLKSQRVFVRFSKGLSENKIKLLEMLSVQNDKPDLAYSSADSSN